MASQLQYRMAEPLEDNPPYPVIVLLHGRGSNELDLLPLGHQLDPCLLVVSPRAPYSFGPGSYYWYDLEADVVGRPSKETIQLSLVLVESLMDEIADKYEIDPKRLFVGGFSMGGAMTAGMVMTRARRLAGAMILSGYVPIHSHLEWDPATLDRLPVFQAHGTLDQVLPIQFGRMSRDFLEQTPVKLSYQEYPIGHQVSAQELGDASAWIRALL